MNLACLQKDIRNNNLGPFYIFHGTEIELINTYIDKMAKVSGLPINHVGDVESAYSNITGASFLTNKGIYVVIDDTKFIKSSLWSTMNTSRFSGNILILIYTVLDKRTKFYNHFKDQVILFESLQPKHLAEFLAKTYRADIDQINRLVNRCDCNYGRCLLECKKVQTLCNVKGWDFNRALEYALDTDFIVIDCSNVLDKFVQSILDVDYELSWQYYKLLIRNNEAPLKILSAIYNSFRPILQIQSCASGVNLYQKCGISNDTYNKVKPFLGVYENSVVWKGICLLQQIESGIKTGSIDSDLAIDIFLCQFYFEDLMKEDKAPWEE